MSSHDGVAHVSDIQSGLLTKNVAKFAKWRLGDPKLSEYAIPLFNDDREVPVPDNHPSSQILLRGLKRSQASVVVGIALYSLEFVDRVMHATCVIVDDGDALMEKDKISDQPVWKLANS